MLDFIEKLRQKPYETRVRILWTTVFAAVIILVAILIFSVKNTLQDVDGRKLIDLNPPSQAATALAKIPYASVERVERTAKILKIYFNFHNTTDEILNISKLSDIKLEFAGKSAAAQSITDRQGKPYVQKILSRTQNFGILIFEPVNSSTATLTFDQMYLESNPGHTFQQKLELNLDELSKSTKLRN